MTAAHHPHTLIIGLRASGKSTIAPQLAARLQQPHADLDNLVYAALNVASAGEAFRALGEPAFRAAEAQQLTIATATQTPTVIALGGGTPTAPTAATLLNTLAIDARARIIYLRANPVTLAHRLRQHDDNRPSLTGKRPADELPALFKRRDPLYRAIATHTLNTDPPRHAIDATLERLVAIAAASTTAARPS